MPSNSNPTQAQAILSRLQQSPGEWVGMPELAEVSGAYAVHSRAAQLRKEGYKVENKCRKVEGKTHSFYRIPLAQPTS
jgi:hypothetical protein